MKKRMRLLEPSVSAPQSQRSWMRIHPIKSRDTIQYMNRHQKLPAPLTTFMKSISMVPLHGTLVCMKILLPRSPQWPAMMASLTTQERMKLLGFRSSAIRTQRLRMGIQPIQTLDSLLQTTTLWTRLVSLTSFPGSVMTTSLLQPRAQPLYQILRTPMICKEISVQIIIYKPPLASWTTQPWMITISSNILWLLRHGQHTRTQSMIRKSNPIQVIRTQKPLLSPTTCHGITPPPNPLSTLPPMLLLASLHRPIPKTTPLKNYSSPPTQWNRSTTSSRKTSTTSSTPTRLPLPHHHHSGTQSPTAQPKSPPFPKTLASPTIPYSSTLAEQPLSPSTTPRCRRKS